MAMFRALSGGSGGGGGDFEISANVYTDSVSGSLSLGDTYDVVMEITKSGNSSGLNTNASGGCKNKGEILSWTDIYGVDNTATLSSDGTTLSWTRTSNAGSIYIYLGKYV